MARQKLFAASLIFTILVLGLVACQSYDKQSEKLEDTYYRGTINISADESFRPVIDQEVLVYQSQHPRVQLRVTYKPEAECLKDLYVDSVRMIIATRKATKDEEQGVADSLKVSMSSVVLAKDAVAMIVNPATPDSFLTMNEVRAVLKGNFNKNLIPVFDGTKATSTIRFIIDSVLHGESLTAAAVAARTSEGVVDYIAKTKDAVGFIGVEWIGNSQDSLQISFLKKVKIVNLESTDHPGKYVLPYAVNIASESYPMVRDLVCILKEKQETGLGHGFRNFLKSEIGQLIFKRAYLVPVQRDFIHRKMQLNEKAL